MAHPFFRKKKYELVPGTLIQTESGRYLAYYEHRSDIIANGENEKDALKNLRELYKAVMQHETQECEKKGVELPKSYKTKSFKDKIACT